MKYQVKIHSDRLIEKEADSLEQVEDFIFGWFRLGDWFEISKVG